MAEGKLLLERPLPESKNVGKVIEEYRRVVIINFNTKYIEERGRDGIQPGIIPFETFLEADRVTMNLVGGLCFGIPQAITSYQCQFTTRHGQSRAEYGTCHYQDIHLRTLERYYEYVNYTRISHLLSRCGKTS